MDSKSLLGWNRHSYKVIEPVLEDFVALLSNHLLILIQIIQRTHSQMQRGHTGSISPRSSRSFAPTVSSLNSRSPDPVQLPPLRHFLGDGMDFRRPAPVNRQQAVIDLTEEAEETVSRYQPQGTRPAPPPPPQSANIIDLSVDTPAQRRNLRTDPSPDVEVLWSRPLPHDQQARANPVGQARRGADQHNRHRTRADGGHSRRDSPPQILSLAAVRNPHMNAAAGARHVHHLIMPRDQRVQFQGALAGMFALPDLNYDQPAFDLGFVDAMPHPSPTYKAPSPPREGFTRSPKEDDVLVCPNCGDELCAGGTDLKRQVWVVKACGHVSIHVADI